MLIRRCSAHSDTQAWDWAWSATVKEERAYEGHQSRKKQPAHPIFLLEIHLK